MLPDVSTWIPDTPSFRTHAAVADSMRAACDAVPHAAWHDLGESEDGRPLLEFIRSVRGKYSLDLVWFKSSTDFVYYLMLEVAAESGG